MASQAQASQQKLRDQLKEALDAGDIDLQTYLAQLKALRESVAPCPVRQRGSVHFRASRTFVWH